MNEKPQIERSKKSAFIVEPVQVKLILDLDMAIALGDYLLAQRPENPAIAALGHQLQNILPPEPEPRKY
jgi:hypothetical protein